MIKFIFVRFGETPSDGKSKNFLTGELEQGVSVYEAVDRNGKINILLPNMKGGSCVTLSGCLDRKMYQVTGQVIGFGSDGEPLLKDCSIIKELIVEKSSEGWA